MTHKSENKLYLDIGKLLNRGSKCFASKALQSSMSRFWIHWNFLYSWKIDSFLQIKFYCFFEFISNYELLQLRCFATNQTWKLFKYPCNFFCIYLSAIFHFIETYLWCSTKVDAEGVHVSGNWGFCKGNCPIEGK